VVPGSDIFEDLVQALFKSAVVEIYGFYGHAGNAYASTSLDEASVFLSGEVNAVNTAAKLAIESFERAGLAGKPSQRPWVLSVGSTPTAHAASAEAREKLKDMLHGQLELHAGGSWDCTRAWTEN
jgi:D-serine ammonia-lyase